MAPPDPDLPEQPIKQFTGDVVDAAIEYQWHFQQTHLRWASALMQIAERRFLVDDDADERDQMVKVAKKALARALPKNAKRKEEPPDG